MFLKAFAGSQNLNEGIYFCTDSVAYTFTITECFIALASLFSVTCTRRKLTRAGFLTLSLTDTWSRYCSAMEGPSVHFRIFNIIPDFWPVVAPSSVVTIPDKSVFKCPLGVKGQSHPWLKTSMLDLAKCLFILGIQ